MNRTGITGSAMWQSMNALIGILVVLLFLSCARPAESKAAAAVERMIVRGDTHFDREDSARVTGLYRTLQEVKHQAEIVASAMATRRAAGATGGVCVPLHKSQIAGTLCSEVFSEFDKTDVVSVWLSSDLPGLLDLTLAQVSVSTNAISIFAGAFPAVIANGFSVSSVQGVCRTFLPLCDESAWNDTLGLNRSVALPQMMCVSTCRWFIDQITPFSKAFAGAIVGFGLNVPALANNTYPLTNCTDQWTWTPPTMPYWNDGYTYDGYNVTCIRQRPNLTAEGWVAPYCSGALAPVKGVALGCGVPLPGPPILPDQYETLRDVGFYLGLVGLLTNLLFLPLAFLVAWQDYLKSPAHFTVIACVGAIVGNFGFMGTKMVGIDAMWADGGTIATWSPVFQRFVVTAGVLYSDWFISVESFITSSALCSLQGFAIYGATMQVMVSLFFIVWLLVLMLAVPSDWIMTADNYLGPRIWPARLSRLLGRCGCRKWKPTYRHTFVYAWLLACPVPWLVSLGLAAGGKFVMAPGNGYCQLNSQELDFVVPFWNAPLVGLSLGSLLGFFIAVTVFVAKFLRTLGESMKKTLLTLVRGLFVSVIVSTFGLAVSIISIYISATFQDVLQQVSTYYNCKLNLNPDSCSLSDDVYVARMAETCVLLVLFMVLPVVNLLALASHTKVAEKKILSLYRRFHSNSALSMTVNTRDMEEADEAEEAETEAEVVENETEDDDRRDDRDVSTSAADSMVNIVRSHDLELQNVVQDPDPTGWCVITQESSSSSSCDDPPRSSSED